MVKKQSQSQKRYGRNARYDAFRKGFWVPIAGGLMSLTLIITLGVLNRGGTAQATPTYSGASVTQYWTMPLEAVCHAQSVFTDSRTFYIGDSIVMLNGLELQVYRIQRNWQPSAVVAASYGN